MAKFTDKISNLIDNQVPEFVLDDHPYFLEFVKAYYTFMESAELKLESIQGSDKILLETATVTSSYVLLNGTNQTTFVNIIFIKLHIGC